MGVPLAFSEAYRDYDLALYVDGFLATEMGKNDEALDRFNKLLAWFPKSRFVPDAHMVRAEYEFVKDVPDYQAAYREAIHATDTGWAQWYVVPADDKPHAQLLVARTVVARLERLNLRYPDLPAEVTAQIGKLRAELDA